MIRRPRVSAAARCLADHTAQCAKCLNACNARRISAYCPTGIALLHAAADADLARDQPARAVRS